MKKIIILLILVLSIQPAYTYWTSDISVSDITSGATIQIGVWSWDVTDGFNLNIWEDEEILNQYIPLDTLFSYEGILYIVRDGESYNPYYHGLPGEGRNQWAYVSLELEWADNMNYRTNSVVIRNGVWYIANSAYNDDWFVNDPLNSKNKSWSEWRKIEPLLESYFGYLPNYPGVKDYRANINDVIYI